jgi:hypothetical protein
MDNNQNQDNSNSQPSEWKQRELGALWKKNGKTQYYFSGRINLSKLGNEDFVNIVGFSNKLKKENPNAPDVIIYHSPSLGKSALDLDSSNSSGQDDSNQDGEESKGAKETEDSDVKLDDETPF